MLKKTFILLIGVLLLSNFTIVLGQEEIDEDALFSDPETLVKTQDLINESIEAEISQKSVTFSGSVYSESTYVFKREKYALKTDMERIQEVFGLNNETIIDFLNNSTADSDSEALLDLLNTNVTLMNIEDDRQFLTHMRGNFLLDLRLTNGVKGFINLDAYYYPQEHIEYQTFETSDETYFVEENVESDHTVKEVFLDANIDKKVYFRVGKQRLQWGRGYFFNPTDLINIEKKNFLDMDSNREGVYGLKVHIPFGVAYNLYGFLDVGDEIDTEYFAWAGKLEFLIKNTEMAFSGWTKKGHHPIYGFDFSSRIGSVDIFGELSLSAEETVKKLNDDFSISQNREEWIPRGSMGFMKSFDFLNVSDRILVAGEFYYNHTGYYDNVFEGDGKTLALLLNELYEPNNLSVYYTALFFSCQKFIVSDLTLSFSTIHNLIDSSCILLSGLDYKPIYDFTVELTTACYIGKDNAEYTFWGNGINIQLTFKLAF